jgi:hypothetical protein
MDEVIDYDKIMSDKKSFYKMVYTPLSEAIKILEERQKNPELIARIEELLNNDIPEPLRKIDKYAINGKQIATPNFDVRWFLNTINDYNLKPFFYEFHSDKFTSKNYFKHSLCQLLIHKNKNTKNGDYIEEKITIVDFNKYDGKLLNEIKTLGGESLIDFHRKLFSVYDYKIEDFIFYDGSSWLKRNGGFANNFYEKDLLLYVCHGILFENFLSTEEDGDFTKKIFLPSFKKVFDLCGVKPLIVPIPPMDSEIEDGSHWYSYDEKIKKIINKI